MFTPAIASITPNNGPINGGQIVNIMGTNLENPMFVQFGNTKIVSFFDNVASTKICFVTPFGTSGPVNVTVENADGTSNILEYTYNVSPSLPTVTSVSPSNGTANTHVTITGSGFFGGFYVSNNLNGYQTNNTTYNGINNNPFQSVVQSLTINGQILSTQGNNGQNNFIVTNDSQIKILAMPYNPDGIYNIIINTLYGSSVASVNSKFMYVAQPFSIIKISPDYGSSDGGDKITISGVGFSKFHSIINQGNNGLNPNSMTVMFGKIPASFIVVDQDIIATLPSNIFRKKYVDVTVMNNYAKVVEKFEYCDILPIIKNIFPCEGCEGDIVKIKGKNFTNIVSVFFGSKEAKIISVEDSKSIRVVAPKNCGEVEVVINRSNIPINSPLINNSNNNSPVLLPFENNNKGMLFSSKIDNKSLFNYLDENYNE